MKNGIKHDEAGLLDEYAGQAMAGMLANSGLDAHLPPEIAHDAFLFAAAMLKERRAVLSRIKKNGSPNALQAITEVFK